MTVKELKDYKADRTADLARDLSEFEKNFILIAGALLTFSITFIKDIVKIENAEGIWLLFVGWGLIGLSLAAMMYTYLYSSSASHELWKRADAFINKYKLFDDTKSLTDTEVEELKNDLNGYFLPCKKKLSVTRMIAVGVLLGGILTFSYFVGSNLLNENSSKSPPAAKTAFILLGNDTLRVSAADTIIVLKHH